MGAVKPLLYKPPSSVKGLWCQCLLNYSCDEDRAQRASDILVLVEIQAKKMSDFNTEQIEFQSQRMQCNL